MTVNDRQGQEALDRYTNLITGSGRPTVGTADQPVSPQERTAERLEQWLHESAGLWPISQAGLDAERALITEAVGVLRAAAEREQAALAPRRGHIRVRTPDDQVPRWTAEADLVPGIPYTYWSGNVTVLVDWALASPDAAPPPSPALDVEWLARAMELARPAIEKAESTGLRYREIHDDAICARDEHGCGCLCHAATAVAVEYARLAAPPASGLVGVEEDGYHDCSGPGCRTCAAIGAAPPASGEAASR